MNWHYRIFKVVSKNKKHQPYFCIKEYYAKGDYKWTKDPIAPMAESKEELIETPELMLKDARHYNVKVERVA